jgi:hypothetical protein
MARSAAASHSTRSLPSVSSPPSESSSGRIRWAGGLSIGSGPFLAWYKIDTSVSIICHVFNKSTKCRGPLDGRK